MAQDCTCTAVRSGGWSRGRNTPTGAPLAVPKKQCRLINDLLGTSRTTGTSATTSHCNPGYAFPIVKFLTENVYEEVCTHSNHSSKCQVFKKLWLTSDVQVPKGWCHTPASSTLAAHPLSTLRVLHSDGLVLKDMF